MSSNFYNIVKMMRNLTREQLEDIAVEIAAACPQVFLKAAKRLELFVSEEEEMIAKVLKAAQGTTGSPLVRFIRAHRGITRSSLADAKRWVETNMSEHI